AHRLFACCHHLASLSRANTRCHRLFSTVNVFCCCHLLFLQFSATPDCSSLSASLRSSARSDFCYRSCPHSSSSCHTAGSSLFSPTRFPAEFSGQRFQLPVISLLASSLSSIPCCHHLLFVDFCYHRLSLLPSSNTASCDFLCCLQFTSTIYYRLRLRKSSSIRETSATIVCYCCHHLTLLPVTFSAANFPTAVIVFFCCRHLLFSVTSATIVCHSCHHLTLLRMTFSAADIYIYYYRLLLLSSSIRVTSATIALTAAVI
ncbi:hypothetical protein CEXT_431921, partial [Caerostris extrusa]